MTNFAELTTKKARIAHIRTMLSTNSAWAIRGMLRIYEAQTEDEKVSEDTKHDNGVGFNGTDATLLSSYSKQVLGGRTMSPKQMEYIFKKMPKYARQLEGVSAK